MGSELRRWGGQTTDERRAERRTRFVDAAVRLFASNGFRNSGVRALCQDAGLTERYFYESFANREELLAEVFKRVVTAMHVQMQDADDPCLTLGERAASILSAYYGTLRADPTAARVFLVEILGINAEVDALFEDSLFKLSEPLMEVYDPERKGPLARQPLLRRGVAGGLLHIALAWGASDYREPLEAVVAAAVDLCGLAHLHSARQHGAKLSRER